ncbi:ubiquitin-protein ligase E3 A [Nematocida displodere]|uniref:HECT-type E3 ubiquitin transferase n=1 Tax=Nematocida displodere TaxID=1805483 RepID=A0A177EJD6_9MICR|nr:ubiquitin-protein ligase E3 A [Nematocida displodere]
MERKEEQPPRTTALSERLKKQVVHGCENTACVGIFCKISEAEAFADDIVHMLMEYGAYFTCKSLYLLHGKTVSTMKKEKQELLRLVIHPNASTTALPQCLPGTPPEEKPRGEGRDPFNSARSVLEYFYFDLLQKESRSQSVPASPAVYGRGMEVVSRAGVHAELAGIIHHKKNKPTAIMLQGLFYNEISKMKVAYSKGSAIRVVKLFNAVKESVKFEKKYFIRFLEFLQELCQTSQPHEVICSNRCNKMPGGLSYNRPPECGHFEEDEFPVNGGVRSIPFRASVREIEVCVVCNGSLSDCEYPQCDSLCFLAPELCINELMDLIKSLIIVIDNTSVVNMREGTLLISILKTLSSLYDFSVKTGRVHHSVFVNRRFSRLLNYKIEVRSHKEGMASILDYPFILDMAAKADLIHVESTDRMKTELQDSFFRSLFEGKIPPYLNFEVKRETVVEDSLKFFQSLEKGMLWKQMKIKFLGEDGIDSGGIRKEFFQILSQRMLEEWDIFDEKNTYHWIKPLSSEQASKRVDEYYSLGCILGLAAYNGAVLSFYFPPVFYKKLLGHPTVFEDLKQIDMEVYKTLTAMKTMSAEEVDQLCLEFPSGSGCATREVTRTNLDEFIRAYHEEILEMAGREAFEEIRKGIWAVCEDTFIRSLLPCELSTLIGGVECQNLEEIEKYTIYNGYRKDSVIVQYFWEIFRAYDKQTQKKFLRFVTGSDRAPSGGLSKMAIVFMRNGGDTDRLPSSQTCFNTLLIPEYATKEKLQEKLDIAVQHTEGFFLL